MGSSRFIQIGLMLVLLVLAAGCDGGDDPVVAGDTLQADTASGDVAADVGDSSACTPACEGLECGDDGCGGSCGTCPQAAPFCSAQGVCSIEPCVPSCEELECGDDGCGGSCGTCPMAAPFCDQGLCRVEECVPSCEGLECGDDGCGGSCGTCPMAAPLCNEQGRCEVEVCTPSCGDRECGDDGCGGSCGTCPQMAPNCTDDGLCTMECQPQCQGKVCGDNGCGGLCGTCPGGKTCEDAACVDVPVDEPQPVISCEEGEEVIPQTVLHLSAGQSIPSQGQLTGYNWSVVQPEGSVSTFYPAPTYPDPTFEVNNAGTYIFSLKVSDSSGKTSTYPAMFQVEVIPDEALHIELIWSTPADPNESDEGPEAGSDLDIHFTHPLGETGSDLDGDGTPDPWFNQPFDCFWFNAHPQWASFDPEVDDDPGLDRDDTDGGGPENINLNLPENVAYRVGVHYWNDHGFGPSLATVKVYKFSQLVFSVENVSLVNQDLWEVCKIIWEEGNGTVVPVLGEGDSWKITHDYVNPFFMP